VTNKEFILEKKRTDSLRSHQQLCICVSEWISDQRRPPAGLGLDELWDGRVPYRPRRAPTAALRCGKGRRNAGRDAACLCIAISLLEVGIMLFRSGCCLAQPVPCGFRVIHRKRGLVFQFGVRETCCENLYLPIGEIRRNICARKSKERQVWVLL
jgi:hypothetical protein